MCILACYIKDATQVKVIFSFFFHLLYQFQLPAHGRFRLGLCTLFLSQFVIHFAALLLA